jgi:protein SCO1
MQLHGVVTHLIDQDGVWRGNFHGLNFQTLNLVTFVNALTNKIVPHEHPEDEASFWDSLPSIF